MNVRSLAYLAFLAVTVLCSLGLARRSMPWAKRLLLCCCVLFLLLSGWSGAALAIPLLVTWGIARQLESCRRRVWFALGVCALVGELAAFKYLGFFTGGAVRVSWVPLGLSFFTFQQIWYLKERYQGREQGQTLEDYTLYSLFFPTITSGPILRPDAFFPQLSQSRFLHPTAQDGAAGVYAICCGAMKKALLADPLGIVVGNGWAHLGELSAPEAWLTMLGYTFQLYFDFSGYCDIAAGSARLLGVRLPVNFNSPYRSLSVTEFWKRWHITLTSFLRECLYFPLGGSRRGAIRTDVNIMIVFLVSGFWHGAGWTFLVWGALHGLAQVVERALGAGRERLPRALRWALTFLFVNLAWVFFRAPDLAGAAQLLRAAVSGGLAAPEAWLATGLYTMETSAAELVVPALANWTVPVRLAVLFAAAFCTALWPRNAVGEMDAFRPTPLRAAVVTVGMVWAILSFTGVATFIYSNF